MEDGGAIDNCLDEQIVFLATPPRLRRRGARLGADLILLLLRSLAPLAVPQAACGSVS